MFYSWKSQATRVLGVDSLAQTITMRVAQQITEISQKI